MKIAFVVHTSYPEFIGGRENHVHNLASVLARTDDVIVVSGGKCDKINKTGINGYTLITLPMISIKVSGNPLQIYRIVRGVFRILKQEKPDIIHAFEYGSNTTDMAYLYSMFYGVPLVLTVYGYQFRYAILKILKKFYDFSVGKLLFWKADMIFCNSETQFDEVAGVIGKKAAEKKIIFQANCINCSKYENLDKNRDLVARHDLEGKTVILTVTRILPRKGIKYLLYAVDSLIRKHGLNKIKFIIIGPDCGEKDNIIKIKDSLNLNDNIDIVDEIPYEEIREYISVCDLFVLPSLYEGLPLAVLEAMAAGKAVVFSNLPCAKRIITHEKEGLLVEPKNSDNLADAIRRLVLDPDLRGLIGKNAKEKVRELDSEVEAENTRKRYKKILDNKK